MKDRIKAIMESQHMTQQTFSQLLGISSASLSNVFTGRTNPTLNIVESICQKIPGISLEWLMFGKGTMIENQSNIPVEAKPQIEQSLFSLLDAAHTKPEVKTGAKRKEDITKKSETVKDHTINELKISDKSKRHITEIRVYFDDQTYETFVPEKS